jgi:FkbM family methyltransferase
MPVTSAAPLASRLTGRSPQPSARTNAKPRGHPLKFRLLSRLHRHFGAEPRSPVRSFGYDMHFVDFKQFCFVVGEVFREQTYYFRCQNREPFIIDCGSNIGLAILYFHSLFPEARMLGFEPFEPAFRVLSQNIATNGLHRVTVHQAALWTGCGTASFFYNPERPHGLSNSLDPDRVQGRSTWVRTVRLSDYIDRRVDFVKMDIEGAELPVLEELEQRGRLAFIDQMTIEYHHHLRKDEDRFSGLLLLLERNNFGYQLSSRYSPFAERDEFQDLVVYAYNKDCFKETRRPAEPCAPPHAAPST